MRTLENASRRHFIKSSTALGVGLALGVQLSSCSTDDTQLSSDFKPSVWLKIDSNNQISVILSKSEMGQGVLTALTMLIAEELDADLSDINIELADAADVYGSMLTAGSTSIKGLWQPLRSAGAAAREMLLGAAASKWAVPVAECSTDSGRVSHRASGQSFTYGELAKRANQQAVPASPKLKEIADYKIIGQSVPRIEALSKVMGQAKYGIDTEMEGLKYAAIRQAPVFGASVKSVDNSEIKFNKHVLSIVNLDNAVAVVADSYWQAQMAVDALEIQWTNSKVSKVTDASIKADYQQLIKQSGTLEYEKGSLSKAKSVHSLSVDYEVAFQAHAAMEPMNCTAHVHEDGCEVWVPTQHPQGALDAVKAELQTGLKKYIAKALEKIGAEETVKIHTTLLGGGFGRRLEQDFVIQAVQISSKAGVPVKLIWSREEDIQHDFYRPYTYHHIEADISAESSILDWRHRIAGPTHGRSTGGSTHLPYDMAHVYIDYHKKKHGIPIGSWRSIGSAHNAFVIESFIDEIAHKAGQDPFQYRKSLMKDHPRSLAVLEKAASAAGWGKNNTAMGLAVHPGFGSYTAQVVEISIKNAKIIVKKVVCAVDCGLAVNPDIVKAQIEGGIVFGMTAALKKSIQINNGRVKQSNFHNYPLLELSEMPEIEVHIIPSTEPPGGIGEVSVPPIAPAIANAVFAITGKRIRQLPLLIS
jgi:isoquinoline 1-oxidoreductase subunit beta